MNLVEFYAKYFGIGEHELHEASWLSHWITRNQNRLRYCCVTYRWWLH